MRQPCPGCCELPKHIVTRLWGERCAPKVTLSLLSSMSQLKGAKLTVKSRRRFVPCVPGKTDREIRRLSRVHLPDMRVGYEQKARDHKTEQSSKMWFPAHQCPAPSPSCKSVCCEVKVIEQAVNLCPEDKFLLWMPPPSPWGFSHFLSLQENARGGLIA